MRRISVLLLVGLLGGCASTGVATPKATSVARSPYSLSADAIKVVEAGVRKSLKDPNSAIFGSMVAAKNAAEPGVYVCGYVNAKNSFGGYTGDQPFMGLLAVDAEKGPFYFGVTGMGGADTATTAVLTVCREYGVAI